MNYENQDSMAPAAPELPATSSPEAQFSAENLAEDQTDEKLTEIGDRCLQGFEIDKRSRSEWEMCLQDWIDLARQYSEPKSYPWPNASNIKYPLLATAAMQFAARAYPSLVPSGGKLVKSVVIGKDPTGEKYEKGDRVSTYMSYQFLHDMDGWEEGMDKMLMQLPIVGTMFKKTWYDKSEDKICSDLILPLDLVVNYWTKSMDNAERVSEIILMSPRVLKEKQNEGLFLDKDLGTPRRPEQDIENAGEHVADDETVPYTLIEQHTFYDLDDDGYAEPYIITFERFNGTVLRIERRFQLDDMELQDDDKTIKKIKPTQMYTKFGFIPNPDGSFYDIGFGVLLGPLNESVNTLINQLVDAGTLNNLQSGFIGKSLRLRMGDTGLAPGEWKPVNSTGDDLRKQIVPLPTKEPSAVLFQLMGTLITSGKELASVAEIFTGKMPGQNTPATTTMATVEQGMKVFTAVYKRIFRALSEEFKKVFTLNKTYIDPNKYVTIIDTQIGPDDFDLESYDICPAADPTATSNAEKMQKAQALVEMLQIFGPMLNPIEIITRIFDAQEQPNPHLLFSQEVQQTGQVPPPPPDPKMLAMQAKAQVDQQKAMLDGQMKQQEMELNARDRILQMQMDKQEHAMKMEQEVQSTQLEAASKVQMANIFSAAERMKSKQTMVNKQEEHQQKMTQQKEASKLKSQNQNTKSGNSTR